MPRTCTHGRAPTAPASPILSLILLASFALLPLSAFGSDSSDDVEEATEIALVFDGPSDANDRNARALEQEISEHYDGSRTLSFARQHRFEADYTVESVTEEIERARAQDPVSVVIAVDPLGSQVISESTVDNALLQDPITTNGNGDVLVAAALLPAPLQQGGRLEGENSFEDIVAIEAGVSLRHDIERVSDLFTAEEVAIGIPAYLLNSIDHLERALLSYLDTGEFAGLVELSEEPDPAETVSALSISAPRADALLLFPEAALTPSDRETLFAGIHDAGVATISVLAKGPSAGTAASLYDRGFEETGRRIAVELDDYLDGSPGFPAAHIPRITGRLWIDTELLADSGIEPTREALLEAEIEGLPVDVDGDGPSDDDLQSKTLLESVRMSVDRNLELAGARYGIDIAETDRREARSLLLPQIEAGTSVRAIDETRAELPIAPDQFSAVAEAELQQVIFSEPAWANLEIRGLLVESEQFQYEVARADTAGEAAEAYIDLLQARSLVELRRRAVGEQQFNLDRAEIRRDLEEAGPEDVYRFRSELALARQELSEALALERAARMQLNRIADRPQRALFSPTEPTADAPEDILPASGILAETEGVFELDLLEERIVARALEHSPEIRALERGLSARDREVLTRQREFYSPTIALAAGIEQEYWSAGTGFEEEIDLGPLEDEIESEFGFSPELGTIELDDFYEDDGLEWEVGIRLSIPITTGGERRAVRDRAEAERDEIATELASAMSLIEQRARTAFVEASAAAEAIRETREAASAAEDALEFVSEAYNIGAAGVADLVDAQERANEARILARNQTYEYLNAFAELLRAIGADTALSDYQAHHEIEQFFRRLGDRPEDSQDTDSEQDADE